METPVVTNEAERTIARTTIGRAQQRRTRNEQGDQHTDHRQPHDCPVVVWSTEEQQMRAVSLHRTREAIGIKQMDPLRVLLS